jgi:septal ring factor EnvC (AmiA/AmiB activator)
MIKMEWQKWLTLAITAIIVPWATWTTVTIYSIQQDIAVKIAIKTEQIQQIQVNASKLSDTIEKINSSISEMKNEQVRQGVMLENISKQLAIKTPFKKDFVYQGNN